jgi:hypothetical protein
MNRQHLGGSFVAPALGLLLACWVAPVARAEGGDVPSRHELMKECMAKQKEAQSGKNRDEMRAFCADWAKTQRDADKNTPAPAKN